MSARFLGLSALLAALATGCWLPVSTAAPQSATTVGQGNLGFSYYGEGPTLDLLATADDPALDGDYGKVPLPTQTIQLAYGLSDKLDLEAALDGVLYIVVPLPLGGSVGARYQVVEKDDSAVSLTSRLGYVGLGVSSDESGSDRSVSATYVQVGVVGQLWPRNWFRPGVSLNLMPAWVRNELDGSTPETFSATAANLTVTTTFAIGPVEIGPFVNAIYFRSPNFRGTSAIFTGGLIFSIRARKWLDRGPPQLAPPIPPPPGAGPPGG